MTSAKKSAGFTLGHLTITSPHYEAIKEHFKQETDKILMKDLCKELNSGNSLLVRMSDWEVEVDRYTKSEIYSRSILINYITVEESYLPIVPDSVTNMEQKKTSYKAGD